MHLDTKCEGRTQYVQQKYFIFKVSFSRLLSKLKKNEAKILHGERLNNLYSLPKIIQ